jgi:hypothetical protein
MHASAYWITVVELPEFQSCVRGELTSEEGEGLTTFLAHHPDDGEVIPETGGLRRLCWPSDGTRKCGVTVVYYFHDLNMPVYLLAAFPKNVRFCTTKSERLRMKRLVSELVQQHWTSRVSPRLEQALWPIS